MSTYPSTNYRPGSGSSRYIPDGYDAPTSMPQIDGDKKSHLTPPPRHSASSDFQSSRPYTPPNPEQYSASPSYRAPLDDRPANPDVQAIQAAAGYGTTRPRSSSDRSRRPSHTSGHSHRSHHSHDEVRRPSHESHHSHRSHHSSAGRSHHSSSAHGKAREEPYRTESEREEYIKELKRINSKRPT